MDAQSSRIKGAGEKAGYEFRAKKAERAAEFGRMQAELTDTHFRDELNTTLNNIDTIRAAGRIDPGSPTSAAIAQRQMQRSDIQRLAAVGNQRAQASEDDASAAYLHQAGDFALAASNFDAGRKEFMGTMDATRKLVSGIGKMGMPGG